MITRKEKRLARRHRIRSKVSGTGDRPRMAIFRSNLAMTVQIIDDEKGETLVSASDLEIKTDKNLTKKEKAKLVGELVGKKAKEKNIQEVVFDRGGFKFYGRVKSLAEGARKELKF